jgi:prepilin-type N-terminal cleavage/methylation domain-containing protein
MLSTSSGFTIPELIIAITVSTVLLSMLFGPLNDLYRSSSTGLRSIVQITNTRAALRRIEHNITLAAKFLPSNYNNISSSDNITDSANSTTWNWQGSNNSDAVPATGLGGRVLVTENYGTDSSGNAVLSSPSCDVTTPQIIHYVYFVKNSNLYRRTLVASSYPSGCNGASVTNKRTCPPAASRPSGCQANDALIASGVTKFSIDYYASANTSTPLDNSCGDQTHTCYTTGSNSAIPTSAHSVVITITITTGTGVNAVDATSQIRLTRINGT